MVFSHVVFIGCQLVVLQQIEFSLSEDQINNEALHIMTDKIQTMLHSIYGYTHSDNNIEWFDDQYRYLYLWINQCLDCCELNYNQ